MFLLIYILIGLLFAIWVNKNEGYPLTNMIFAVIFWPFLVIAVILVLVYILCLASKKSANENITLEEALKEIFDTFK